MTTTLPIATGEGTFWASYSDLGLRYLDFPGPSRTAGSAEATVHWHEQTEAAVAAILGGKDPIDLPPLDLRGGTEFQKQVWQALRSIKRGQTVSYGEIAVSLGRAGSARAVGSACGANPIPLLIPCHRVLAANGEIGGFSGGLPWKIKLLSIEQIRFKMPSRRAAEKQRELPWAASVA